MRMCSRGCYTVTFSHRISVALLISKPSKNFVSQTVLLPCNSKRLIFDLNRKRNKCWLATYSFELFTCISVIYDTTLPVML